MSADTIKVTSKCPVCHQPTHLATGTDFGQPWSAWTHDKAIDEVMCGKEGWR